MRLKSVPAIVAFLFIGFSGFAIARAQSERDEKSGNLSSYVRNIFSRRPKTADSRCQCTRQGCSCRTEEVKQPPQVLPAQSNTRQLQHPRENVSVLQVSAIQDPPVQGLSLQPALPSPGRNIPSTAGEGQVNFSASDTTRVEGRHLPGGHLTATERALDLLKQLQELEGKYRSQQVYLEKLEGDLREQKRLVGQLRASSEEDRFRLSESERSREELAAELQATKRDFILYQQRASRMLESIRTELDDAFVREVVAEGQGT